MSEPRLDTKVTNNNSNKLTGVTVLPKMPSPNSIKRFNTSNILNNKSIAKDSIANNLSATSSATNDGSYPKCSQTNDFASGSRNSYLELGIICIRKVY